MLRNLGSHGNDIIEGYTTFFYGICLFSTVYSFYFIFIFSHTPISLLITMFFTGYELYYYHCTAFLDITEFFLLRRYE